MSDKVSRTFFHHIISVDTREKGWLERLDREIEEKGQDGFELVTVLHSLQQVIAFMKCDATVPWMRS